MKTSQVVEAVLFASDAPLKADEIARADEDLDEDRVEAAIQELRAAYDETDRAFRVAELAEGYQLLTRPEFSTYLERFDTVPKSPRLSGPARETLAIVAYRQPISRIEVEYIRGVSSSGVLRTLQDRGLIDVVGRGEGLGRPYLYGTTRDFLDHFGFGSLEELPRTEELPVVLRDPVPLEEEAGGEEVEPVEVGVVEDSGDDGPSVEEAVSRVLEGMPDREEREEDEEGERPPGVLGEVAREGPTGRPEPGEPGGEPEGGDGRD